MSQTLHKGADALAGALLAHGVRRLFALSGNHVMPVFDAALRAGIDLVHVRHEAATVHMADAWARLTGEAGVALVTGGPGHANAVGALYTALMADSPLVLLSGHAPLTELGRGAFQEMRQAEMAAPVTKASWVCAEVGKVAEDVATALQVAKRGRPGPVHLSLPVDLLEAEIGPRANAAIAAPGATNELVAPDGAVAEIGPRANAAIAAPGVTNELVAPDGAIAPMDRGLISPLPRTSRPLILCGPACMRGRGRALMAALEKASGIPVVGMESPRGVADPSLGAFAQVLARADSVLLVGKALDFTLKFGKAFGEGCEVIEADPQADPLQVLEALARSVTAPRPDAWLKEVRTAIAYRPAEWDRLHTVQVLRALQPILDEHPDSVFVCDGGEFGQWAQACLSAPHRVINGVAGSIGAALPFAVAARLAQPEAPVIAVMGDGTFGFHPAEIDTAVRYKLPFVAIVGNDARWNAEYQIQLRDYGPERLVGCELLPTRYDQVAKAFGGYGEHVTEPAQVLPAVRRAIASGLPAVVNVAIEGLAAPVVKSGPGPSSQLRRPG